MATKDSDNLIIEKKNVLNILDEAIKSIKNRDYMKLKELSNRTIHSASIYQDPSSISIAVVMYSLNKIFERRKYSEEEDCDLFCRTSIESLILARENFKKGNIKRYRENIHEINKAIEKLEGNIKNYIGEVFRKAMINKASRIYEHGISMQRTAELLGISEWELSEYAGRTGISDVNLSITMDIKTRIEKAMELFR